MKVKQGDRVRMTAPLDKVFDAPIGALGTVELLLKELDLVYVAWDSPHDESFKTVHVYQLEVINE